MIIIIDFGSQTCHLIGRRLRDFGVEIKIIDPETSIKEITKLRPAGIILSGGPASVYEQDAPSVDPRIFAFKIPILGICYGWQITAHLLGGKVASGHKEYGPAQIKISGPKASKLFTGLPDKFQVWMSHGDSVVANPPGFVSLAQTATLKSAAVADQKNKIYGIQFHPEVEHTEFGREILKNFAHRICGIKIKTSVIDVNRIINAIQQEVGHNKVICAISGGVDSTVTAALISKAIGSHLYPVYIESGLMRVGTQKEVESIFGKLLKVDPIIVKAEDLFLKKLKNVTDPEEKRQIIGSLYIRLFEQVAKKLTGVKYLAQGTIYSDVIESRGTRKADKIKSHHNVGGLPKKLKLKLLEPLRFFYKDEVRQIGTLLGLPHQVVHKQVFPGPGQAIRIVGEVTPQRLRQQQQADQIVISEIKKAGLYDQVFMSFPIMTNTKSVAVKGDGRSYLEVVALRVVNSSDIMTTDWARLTYDLLQKISSLIVNEVPGISRVVYDITTKPPATMEWE